MHFPMHTVNESLFEVKENKYKKKKERKKKKKRE